MTGRLPALILLSTVSLIQPAEVPHQISLTLARLGDNITLMCPVSEKEGKFFHWYKQSLGYMVQRVATEILSSITVSEPFKNSRFTVTKEHNQHVLSIRNISKEDEATYLCQNGTAYSQTFIKGTFLAVNDHNQQTSVYVKQSPESESAHLGGSVTLQCSLLSKSQENRVQCPGEHNVHWFRAGSGYSHPSVLYTQRNRSDGQEERSCVYSLSKTIQDSSDTGTYYCAVVTCGQILFGEGTKVEARPELDPLVLVLGVLLACCVVVIAALIFFTCRRRVCEQCQGAMSASPHQGHNRSTVEQSKDLDSDAETVNYAAVSFSTNNAKRAKKRESQDCLYSTVVFSTAGYHVQHQPSL